MQTRKAIASPETDPSAARLEALIARLSQGETAAMGPIYDMTSSAVYAYALAMLKHSFDAEDVLHDCYLRLYAASGSYRPQGKPMAYLITIARNLCLDRLQERARHTELPEEDRQIVVLHAVTGLKHREIAQLMGLPLATVLSKYARAMKKLRKTIAERNEEA